MARILLLLGHGGNRRLLGQALQGYELAVAPVSGMADDALPEGGFDLVIADRKGLLHWRDALARLRSMEEPALLPVLLILREPQLRAATRLLGGDVDDIVTTPVQGPALAARAGNLIRLRRLSVAHRDRLRDAARSPGAFSRAYSILAACNEHVIHAETESDLFHQVLRDLVGNNGYRAAWMGMGLRDEARTVDIVACCAISRRSLCKTPIRWDDSKFGHGPAGRAIRERAPVVCQDISTEPGFAPWREPSLAYGIVSALALPLIIDDDQVGVLCIYASVKNVFNDAEIDLLRRLAANVAHGSQALRARADLQEQKKLAQELAYRDALTGLPNRQWVLEELAKLDVVSARHQRAGAVLFLDLDGFKRINDGLGHQTGDRLLKMVAERLRELAREEDFVARLGGDEFLILMTLEQAASEQQHQELLQVAGQVAERVIEGMHVAFEDGPNAYFLGVSVGICLFPADTKRAVDLVDYADKAMYRAKSCGGRGYQFYSDDLVYSQNQHLQLENQLRHAVNDHSFEIHYQPIINLETGRAETIEALMRWPQADGSIRGPVDFIHILEETGLITRAGQWLITQACNDLRLCRAIAPGLRLALNLSVNQLWQPRLAEQIAEIVHAVGLPPQALVLEVTEISMMSDIGRVDAMLRDFHSRGFAIAIDDFGTGHSSLWRLKGLPVDTLKLDRSLLKEAADDPGAAALVKTIVQMARNLDMQLVAEGIETEAQYQLMRQLQCPLGQGYHFARPMPQRALEPMLRGDLAQGVFY